VRKPSLAPSLAKKCVIGGKSVKLTDLNGLLMLGIGGGVFGPPSITAPAKKRTDNPIQKRVILKFKWFQYLTKSIVEIMMVL